MIWTTVGDAVFHGFSIGWREDRRVGPNGPIQLNQWTHAGSGEHGTTCMSGSARRPTNARGLDSTAARDGRARTSAGRLLETLQIDSGPDGDEDLSRLEHEVRGGIVHERAVATP